MLNKMRNLHQSSAVHYQNQLDLIRKETSNGQQSLVKQSRAMTNILSEKLDIRNMECSDLISY